MGQTLAIRPTRACFFTGSIGAYKASASLSGLPLGGIPATEYLFGSSHNNPNPFPNLLNFSLYGDSQVAFNYAVWYKTWSSHHPQSFEHLPLKISRLQSSS